MHMVRAVLHTVCPTSSSTPRKSLPNETVVTPFSGVNISDFTSDIIGWSNDSKPTPYTKQREAEAEVVSKAEYLKLLDEMEELRQEVDSLRQNAQLLQMHNNNISKPEVNDKEQLVR
ncbi:unnamed protein product [Trichobilharzia regenti]|nr:unnamed protein product [Trichobilharzia regenti]